MPKAKSSKKVRASKKLQPSKKSKQKSSNSFDLQVGEHIWPTERDVLFRPDRLKYVRKLIKSDGCVFCESQRSKINFESLLLFKSKLSMVVLNKYPYNPGHLLILPQRHCGDLLALSDAEYFDLMETYRMAFRAVSNFYQPSGINMGLNHGAVAGAGIPEHIHYHLVPRWSGDVNFFPLIAETKALPTDLETSYEGLRKEFAKKEYQR
jgi:ATP adenylyltransferase